ncbi:MAG: Crp/Fnr family transcriptional regulator [Gammaproteobacteria bacterium]|nr:Crp/Fnr family transcriptional regulator [Gammaproteobacteria bacterium]MDP2139732.1 Crp/Fnr family transcriptional regulator [Gammaproteobacteria bacterium]MDP2348935.1 Crp/Fnr family transcriptional regulator [Gammaproteobacteria bacterium]
MVTPELLSAFPLLKQLPYDVLSQMAPLATLRKFARRGIVLNAGVREDCLCFLFEGRLQGVDFTIDGREVGLYFVEPGDFCGELGLFDRGPQPEYVIALTAAVTVFIPMETISELMLNQPGLVKVLGERLAARLRQMTRQRSLLGLPSINQRVCCQLWMLVPEEDKTGRSQSLINNPPTHMEIAIMLNLSRETVTRVFQSLQVQQIVKRDGPSRLHINDLEVLRELAEGRKEL